MKVLINNYRRKRLVRCKACKSWLWISLTDCKRHSWLDYGHFQCDCPLCEATLMVGFYKK